MIVPPDERHLESLVCLLGPVLLHGVFKGGLMFWLYLGQLHLGGDDRHHFASSLIFFHSLHGSFITSEGHRKVVT